MNDRYDELIKQGYTEENIDLSFLDGISRMEIIRESLGEKRDDRKVVVTDSAGLSKQTSSIMMGYNKQGITLPNGEYVSWEEVELKLEDTLNTDEEEITYVCRKTGKTVEPSEIVADLLQRSTEKTHLSLTPTDKVTNQQAAQMTVHDERKGDFSKGVSMLGNDGIQLPSGQYVSKEEIELALNDYVKLKGPNDKVDDGKEISSPTKEESHRVIKRISQKLSVIPIIIAMALEVIFGFGRDDIIGRHETLRNANNINYGVAQVQKIDHKFETKEDVLQRVYSTMVAGEEVKIDTQTNYYHNSQKADPMGVIGEDLDYGDYRIDGFSILLNGDIQEVEFKKGEDLYSVLEETSQRLGVSVNDLEPMVHTIKVGGPIAGWVTADNLFSLDEMEPMLENVEVILDESASYDGYIEDFQGDTITFNNGSEDVTINIKDVEGNFIEEGTLVVGSDGQEYQMTNLEVTSEDIIDYEEVKTGTKVNWSFKNITLEEHLAAAAIAVIGTAISARKKKEMVDMTDSQIAALTGDKKREFEENKEEYEGASAFKRATEDLINKKVQYPVTAREALAQELIDHNITVEDIRHLGEEPGGKSK